MNQTGATSAFADDTPMLSLAVAPERRLIRPSGSHRHVDFHITVDRARRPADRLPLLLALVLDRSGSMSGGKVETAKRAALAVVDRLEGRDSVAVVVYDDRIDTLQPLSPVTAELRARLLRDLARVQARGSTALHEGWLTGCRAIAGESLPAEAGVLARCFLLTDGLANVGLTDAEAIASEAAGVFSNAGIVTSTFGIGADYDEGLLAPMAVAGGGQFHHLRQPEEIARTFTGELGEMFHVAAANVLLEVEVPYGVEAEAISAYRLDPEPGRASASIGDLLAGEERHVVVRFAFPEAPLQRTVAIRARLTWYANGRRCESSWQEVTFTVAAHSDCDVELRDRQVMHWVGLHHSLRTQARAGQLSRQGDRAGARSLLRRLEEHLHEYSDGDDELVAHLAEVRGMADEVEAAPMPAARAKEVLHRSQTASRQQRDLRGG